MTTESQDRFRHLPIASLRLDPRNPRLPEGMSGQETSQSQLIEFVANEYDSITIARSIAIHGFFQSEPLIATCSGDECVVVEGNRRLAALKLLGDESLRAELDLEDAEEWDELAEDAQIPERIPAVVVDDRRRVAPIVGYRHISGIEKWDPWAKARFIASLLENEDLEFEEAAVQVGETSNDIRSSYRNHRIIWRARECFNTSTDRAERRFGVFTRAMSSLPLRQYIGAPAPGEVERDSEIISDDRRNEVAELLSWLFGTNEQQPVISESRDITRLGKVIASEEGRAVLRETRNLEEAYIAAGGLRERLLRRLNRAAGYLEAAEYDIHEYSQDPEVLAVLKRCKNAVDNLVASATSEGVRANGGIQD